MNNALGPCPLCGNTMTFGYCEGYKEPNYYSPGCINSNCLLFYDGGPTFNSEDEVLKALEKIRKRGERMSKLEKTTFSLYILTFTLGAFGGFGIVPELFVQALFGLVAGLMIGCLWRLKIDD